jgi:hypothetical protein
MPELRQPEPATPLRLICRRSVADLSLQTGIFKFTRSTTSANPKQCLQA